MEPTSLHHSLSVAELISFDVFSYRFMWTQKIDGDVDWSKIVANWEENLSIICLKNNKAENTYVFGPLNGPISVLENVRAQSAILKSACNVHLKI